MEIKQLKIFRVLAEELSFTRTSYCLNYAQSSITANIQSLEHELGVPLFERQGKRVILTLAGQRLKTYAEKIIALEEEALTTVSGNLGPSGVITVGATESLITYRLSPLLLEFRRRFPQMEVIFRSGTSSSLRREVSQGLLDCAFTLEEKAHFENLTTEELVEEPLLVVTSPNHRLASVLYVLPEHMNGETILVTEKGCSYREMFEGVLLAARVYPSVKLEFASVEAIKQCTVAGLGVALLPEISVKREIESGDLIKLPWSGTALPTKIHLVWHREKWLAPPLQAFINMVRRSITDL